MHAHTTASYSKAADPKAIAVTDVAESVNQAPGSREYVDMAGTCTTSTTPAMQAAAATISTQLRAKS